MGVEGPSSLLQKSRFLDHTFCPDADLCGDVHKSETFTPPPEDLVAQYPISSDLSPHGTNGPALSGFSVFQYPIISKELYLLRQGLAFPRSIHQRLLTRDLCCHTENFFHGWNSIGIAFNAQPNAGDSSGAFYGVISLNFKNQSRSTASSAHYRPIVGRRPNYHLISGQAVTKIVFDKKKLQATSVCVSSNKILSAEVWLCLSISSDSSRRATAIPRTPLVHVMRSFSPPGPFTALKFCNFRGLAQKSCILVLASRTWSISRVSVIIFKTSPLCSRPLLVSRTNDSILFADTTSPVLTVSQTVITQVLLPNGWTATKPGLPSN